MNRPKEILLHTKNLTVGYYERKKQLPILKDINIAIGRGELVCSMGQNGIGKSTLLRTLSGVQAPISGDVMIEGMNIHDWSGVERAKKISLVLTDRFGTGNLSVQDIVTMGRYPFIGLDIQLSPIDEAIINWAFDQVGIRELLHQKAHKLSDGQLQKVMIARALAQDGDIIILDEPTAHLDLNNRVMIIRLLKSLAKNTNKVILMATHELDLALQTADRLLLADRNGILQEGLPEDLVLNGTLDRVFDLKGYDLKTGKYQHDTGSLGPIQLLGEGYAYLWTKNALEREGYTLVEVASSRINIKHSNENVQWIISNEDNQHLEVNSIQELILKL
jgi:iron complex transport system ATP-binding protein